jgi:hypothetical protein
VLPSSFLFFSRIEIAVLVIRQQEELFRLSLLPGAHVMMGVAAAVAAAAVPSWQALD